MNYSDWTALGVSVGSLALSGAAFARTERWRAQERRDAAPRFEVLATPMYTLDEKGHGVLSRVNVIAQNTSSAEITVSRIGLAVVGFSRPERVFGHGDSFPQAVKGRCPLYFEIPAIAFPELLGLIAGRSGKEQFVVFVQMGHGSTALRWDSIPFSIEPIPPNNGGFSVWPG